MEPDAEHEEDHSQLGELGGDLRVGDEPGRVRPHRDPREEVAEDRREPKPVRDEATDQPREEADRDVHEERVVFERVLHFQPAKTGRKPRSTRSPKAHASSNTTEFEVGPTRG